MGLITMAYSFGMDRCAFCDKKLKPRRKYKYFCAVKCARKYPWRLNQIMDTLADFPNAWEERKIKSKKKTDCGIMFPGQFRPGKS